MWDSWSERAFRSLKGSFITDYVNDIRKKIAQSLVVSRTRFTSIDREGIRQLGIRMLITWFIDNED